MAHPLDLDVQEEKARMHALDELRRLHDSTTDRMASKLLFSLMDILDKPEVPSHLALIHALLRENSEAAGASQVKNDASLSVSVLGNILSSKVAESNASFSLNCDLNIKNNLNLNIWSSEVDWIDDTLHVYIQLPIPEENEKLTLNQVTSSMIRLELGHRLKVEYPGVTFSVLINHPGIKPTVGVYIDSDVFGSKLILRLIKTPPANLWTYITCVTTDSFNLTFHLDTKTHLTTPKTTEQMMLIRKKGLAPVDCLPEGFADLIWREFKISPKLILESARMNKKKIRIKESGFKDICQCVCDTCIRSVTSMTKPNSIKHLHACEVWWQNDLEHAFICLKKASFIPDAEVHLQKRKTSSGFVIRVTVCESTFTTFIWHELDIEDPIKMEIKNDMIVVRLKMKEKCLWSYVTPFTSDEDGVWMTYHLNPFYHLMVKKSRQDQSISDLDVNNCIASFKSDRLKLGEGIEILSEVTVLHHMEGSPKYPVTEKNFLTKIKKFVAFFED